MNQQNDNNSFRGVCETNFIIKGINHEYPRCKKSFANSCICFYSISQIPIPIQNRFWTWLFSCLITIVLPSKPSFEKYSLALHNYNSRTFLGHGWNFRSVLEHRWICMQSLCKSINSLICVSVTHFDALGPSFLVICLALIFPLNQFMFLTILSSDFVVPIITSISHVVIHWIPLHT